MRWSRQWITRERPPHDHRHAGNRAKKPRTNARLDLVWRPRRRVPRLGPPVQSAHPDVRLAGIAFSGLAAKPSWSGAGLLFLRHSEGHFAADARRVRDGRGAQLSSPRKRHGRCSPASAKALGNVIAAGLGIVTPFCSCSAVPLFIGFVSAGVPLGVTFSFLIAAPMVNEVALGLLFGLVGWQVARDLPRLRTCRRHRRRVGDRPAASRRLAVEAWVREIQRGTAPRRRRKAYRWSIASRSVSKRCSDIVGKVWVWIIAGIAVGALHPRLRAGRTAWPRSWARTPGGRCRPRC